MSVIPVSVSIIAAGRDISSKNHGRSGISPIIIARVIVGVIGRRRIDRVVGRRSIDDRSDSDSDPDRHVGSGFGRNCRRQHHYEKDAETCYRSFSHGSHLTFNLLTLLMH
jgi:hypothetical protein